MVRIAPADPPCPGRGYTYEVGEALRDVRHQQREVKGGVAGPVQAVAELERAQEQRNEAFRLWLSGVMRRERELAKKAAFTGEPVGGRLRATKSDLPLEATLTRAALIA